MSTPHNSASIGEIAKTVLMPGDPLRAKFIAETFLENPKLVSSVRNIYAFTGAYKGKEISVMASGMGMPSMGIYSYELYNFYGVENIIRIGSAGALREDLGLYDIILADSSYSDSTYANIQAGERRKVLFPSKELNDKIKKAADMLGIKLTEGRLKSSDVFYGGENTPAPEYFRDVLGCVAAEMESFALFHNANVAKKNAACLVTVSDSIVTGAETSAAERQNSFTDMMKVALEAAIME